MHFGATMWFTEYSISPSELGIALEERGFESLWASEHSHLPVPVSDELCDLAAIAFIAAETRCCGIDHDQSGFDVHSFVSQLGEACRGDHRAIALEPDQGIVLASCINGMHVPKIGP
jgi:hypothetical protein